MKKGLKRTKLKKKYKNTGELVVFKEIRNEREHICDECSVYISEPSVINFAHKKNKGLYPELRLIKSNISIKCANCHMREHGINNKMDFI